MQRVLQLPHLEKTQVKAATKENGENLHCDFSQFGKLGNLWRYSSPCTIVLFALKFSTAFAIIMLFPFLPFMIEFLIPRLQEDHKSVGKSRGNVVLEWC